MREKAIVRTASGSISVWCGVVAMTVAMAGCGEPPSPGESVADSPTSALDAPTLQRALSSQAQMEASGMSLLGRAWFSPTEFAELYGAGEFVVAGALTFHDGRLAVHPELAPRDEISFNDYVARVKGDIPTPTAFSATANASARDVLLFQPSAAAVENGLTVQRSALVNQFCDKVDFDAFCGSQIGWQGQTTVNSWYTVDNFGSLSFSGNGTSINTVMCADAGDSTLTMTSNSSGAFPASFTQDVTQGSAQWRWWRGGWGQTSHCGSSFLGICLRTDTTIFFTGGSATVGATPKTGSGTNYHFCGNIENKASYVVQGVSNCTQKAACPAPVTFDGQGT